LLSISTAVGLEMSLDKAQEEAFYRSGLAKSVFKMGILEGLPVEYYAQFTNDVFRLLWRSRVRPRFYMVFDAFMSHYKSYETVMRNVKKSASIVWHKIMQNYLSSDEFYRLNRVTAGSVDLAVIAAYQFLKNLLSELDTQVAQQKIKQLQQQTLTGQALNQALQELIDRATRAALAAAQAALQAVQEYQQGKAEAEEAAAMLGGCSGYSHDALSVWTFLERPHEFRNRVRILKNALRMFRLALSSVPTSLEHMNVTAVFGGITGVGIMRDPRQIVDLTTTEHVLPFELFALRLLSRTAVVYQRAAAFRPVIFVDKSGSMAETMPSETGQLVEKIAGAAGLALALYRKLGGEVYLFDTEVEKVSPRDVVRTLLTICADGGTSIEEVLKTIKRIGRRDRVYIVISDGIDEVPEDLAKEVASRYRVGFIILPPSWRPGWLKHFRHVKVNTVEELIRGAIRMVTS